MIWRVLDDPHIYWLLMEAADILTACFSVAGISIMGLGPMAGGEMRGGFRYG